MVVVGAVVVVVVVVGGRVVVVTGGGCVVVGAGRVVAVVGVRGIVTLDVPTVVIGCPSTASVVTVVADVVVVVSTSVRRGVVGVSLWGSDAGGAGERSTCSPSTFTCGRLAPSPAVSRARAATHAATTSQNQPWSRIRPTVATLPTSPV